LSVVKLPASSSAEAVERRGSSATTTVSPSTSSGCGAAARSTGASISAPSAAAPASRSRHAGGQGSTSTAGRPAKVGQREGVPGRADRADDQQCGAADLGAQHAQQRHRRRIRPVQILQNENERAGAGECPDGPPRHPEPGRRRRIRPRCRPGRGARG
jgi:hypothetical protein